MASQKTQDVDSLYVKSIYVRSPANNAPISTNFTLYADGKGGTYWSTLSNANNLPAFTRVRTDAGDFVAGPANSNTFNLRAGVGIGMTSVGPASNNSLYIYQKSPAPAFEFFDVSGDNRICADHCNAVYPFFKLAASGGITLQTNPGTNTVTIGSSAVVNNLVEGPYAMHQFIVTNFSTPTTGWSYYDPVHSNAAVSTYITAYNNSTAVTFMGVDMLKLSTTIDSNNNNVIFFYLSSFDAQDATYISTVIHDSTLVYQSFLNSTIDGLSQTGYISSTQLQSTVAGLGTASYVSSSSLQSTVEGLTTAGYVSSTQLQSSVAGLSEVGYISSSQLQSTVAGLSQAGYISSQHLLSSLSTLGTLGYVSSTQLQSTVAGLGLTYYSTGSLYSTLDKLSDSPWKYVSSSQLQSTVAGLGTASYVSSPSLQSTVAGLSQVGYVSSTQLQSSVAGLSQAGYISSQHLLSSLSTLGTLGYVSSTQLTSTIDGLSEAGYLSTTQLTSTVEGLGLTYYSTGSLVSTLNMLSSEPWEYVSTTQLQSTIDGLGTAGYVSSLGLLVQSTVTGLGTARYISSTQLASTVQTLGGIGYVSSLSLASTTFRLYSMISTVSTVLSPLTIRDPTAKPESSITLQALVDSNASLLISPSVTFNTTNTLSNAAIFFSNDTTAGNMNFKNTNSLSLPGGTLEVNATIRSLRGLVVDSRSEFNNTAVFNGLVSTTNNVQVNGQLRVFGSQTIISTPIIVQNGSVSTIGLAELTSTLRVRDNATFFANTSTMSNVAIGGNLHVASNTTILKNMTADSISSASHIVAFSNATIRGNVTASNVTASDTITTQNLIATTFNGDGIVTASNVTSTVTGLGSARYISTLSLNSTIIGLGTAGYISSAALSNSLTSTVQGLGTATYVSTLSLTSTVQGLGSATYVSSAGLNTSLTSTVTGLGTARYISSSQLTSTVAGLGSANYISSSQLTSTVEGLGLNFSLSSITISSIDMLYDAPQFLIASSNAGLLYSGTGSTWRSTNMATVRDVIYNPNGFLRGAGQAEYIAVGDRIYSSSNALEWDIVYTNPGPQFTPYSAIANGSNAGCNAYVTLVNDIGTNTGRIFYIRAGQSSWTNTGVTMNAHTGTSGGIAYRRDGATDRWVVVGTSSTGQIRVSNDLSTWSSANIFNTNFANGVIYIPYIGQFYAVGNDSSQLTTIRRSATGNAWDSILSGGFASDSGSSNGGAHGIAHNGSNMIVAVGYSTTQAGSIQWSSDGINFNNALSGGFPLSGGAYTGRAVAYNTALGVWLAVDYGTGRVIRSTNGKDWTNLVTLGASLQTNHIFATNDSTPVDTVDLQYDGYTTYVNNRPLVNTPQLTSTTQGLLSTIQSNLPSTVAGLATALYVSSTQLASTVTGLGTATYISTAGLNTALTSTTTGLATANYVSSTQLASTVTGLGTATYISTAGLNTALTSTTTGLGTATYVSSLSLASTVQGLGSATYISTAGLNTALISTTIGLGTATYVSTTGLMSTVQGLGTATYVSSTGLTSTVQGLGTATYVSTTGLTSTVVGLGSATYISSLSLASTVEGLGTAQYISSAQFSSAIIRDPTTGNITTTSSMNFLNSRGRGIISLTTDLPALSTSGTGNNNNIAIGVSTLMRLSTNNNSNIVAIGSAALRNVQSVTDGSIGNVIAIGNSTMLGIILTSGESIEGSIAIGNTAGIASKGSSNIFMGHSAGINHGTFTPGSANIVVGERAGINNVRSGSSNIIVGSLAGSYLSGLNPGFAGSNNITIGTQSGSNASSITNSIYLGYQAGSFARSTNTIFMGTQAGVSSIYNQVIGIGTQAAISTTNSNVTAIGFLAGASNAGTNTIFIGSNSGWGNTGSNTIALGQNAARSNTGSNVIALGLNAGQSNTISDRFYVQGSSATPALVADLANDRLGINTNNNPAYTLDVSGDAFIRTGLLVSSISTSALLASTTITSSFTLTNQNPIWTGQLQISTNRLFYVSSATATTEFINVPEIASTVTGLGTATYVSTLGLNTALASTTTGLGTATYVSTLGLNSALASTTVGLASANYVSSTQLASTVQGLGSATYVSSLGLSTILYSTVAILASCNYVSSTQLASTVTGLGTATYVSTTGLRDYVRSTIAGLGSAGYISSPIEGIVSTVQGLGTAGYISSTQLLSTVLGLLSTPVFSTIRTTNPYITLGPLSGSNAATLVGRTNTSVFLGEKAGSNSLTYSQVAIGSNAGANLRDSNAISIGENAGVSSFGEDPISIGHMAGFGNHGNFSISIGADAGFSSFGSNVVSIGNEAGYDNVGVNNNFLGQQAGYSNSANSVNAFGYQSARQNTGNNVIALGYNAAYLNSGSNVIAIGSNAALANSESNKLFIRGGTKNTVVGDLLNNQIAIGGDSNPTATLDVYGTAKVSTSLTTVLLSTNVLETSSIRMLDNPNSASGFLYASSTDLYYRNTSIVQKLIYTRDLVSTTDQLVQYISSFIDPVEMASTVTGLGTAGFISTLGLDNKLTSTVTGLGTANYISSAQLISTTAGLVTRINDMIDPQELASSIIGLGTAGFVSSIGLDAKLTSTVSGLGTATYISSSGLINSLTSTVTGLGTATYVSSLQLISTTSKLISLINTAGTSTSQFNDLTVSSISMIVETVPAQVEKYILAGSNTGGGNGLKYSLDGSNWLDVASGTFTSRGYATAFGNRLLLAGGSNNPWVENGTIRYSTDGSNWSNAASGAFNQFCGSLWKHPSSNFWLAGGQDSNGVTSFFKYSYDGLNWSNVTSHNFTAAPSNFAWNGSNLYMAVGSGTTSNASIQWSVNGLVWNNASSGGPTNGAFGIAYGNGIWVEAGTDGGGNGQTKWSIDGSNWFERNSGSFGGYHYSVTFGNNRFVMAGEANDGSNNSIHYSTDGSNWTSQSSGGGYMYDVEYITSNIFYAVGNNQYPTVQKSINGGSNWTDSVASGAFTQRAASITYQSTLPIGYVTQTVYVSSGSMYIDTTKLANTTEVISSIAGLGSATYVSTTGLTSTVQGLGSATYISSLGLTSTVAGLGSATYISSSQLISAIQAVQSATNLSNISSVTITTSNVTTSTLRFKEIIPSSPERFIIVGGDYPSYKSIQLSSDGSNFSNALGSYVHEVNNLAYGNGLYIATGVGSSRLLYSSDAITWSSNGITGNFADTAFVPLYVSSLGLWVVGGRPGIKYSTDGSNWSDATSYYVGVDDDVKGLATNGSVIVAAGTVTGQAAYSIQWSSDGSNWNLVNTSVAGFSEGLDVTYANGVFVAVGSYAIIYSTDGSNWNALPSGPISKNVKSVTYGNSNFMAIAQETPNIVYRSINGSNWTSTTTTLGTNVNRVRYAKDSTFYWAGIDGTGSNYNIKYSTDVGSNWSPLVTGGFESQGRSFLYSEALSTTNYNTLYVSSGILRFDGSSFLDTSVITSTVAGLGTANYVSSTQLISTTAGLHEYISSFIDPVELASTVIGLGTSGFVSTIGLDAKLASTTSGLGTANYISSTQLYSTTSGLGTANYISSTQLYSTTQNLITRINTVDIGTNVNVSTASTEYLTIRKDVFITPLYVAGGRDNSGNNIQTSTDGSNWTVRYNTGGPALDFSDIVYSQTNGFFTSGSGAFRSSDGITWISAGSPSGFFQRNGLLFDPVRNLLLICGFGNITNVISYSSNFGDTWTSANTAFTTALSSTGNKFAYNGSNLFVCAGYDTTANSALQWSSDGSNWNAAASGIDADQDSKKYFTDVAFGDGNWVAVNQFGQVKYSTDGSNWSNVTGTFASPQISITYGNGRFLSLSQNTYSGGASVYASTDGSNFTAISSNFASRAYNTIQHITGSTFLYGAVTTGGLPGTQSLALSTDNGSNWSYITSGGFANNNGAQSIVYRPLVTYTPSTNTLYLSANQLILSTPSIESPLITLSSLQSTITGLGTANYVSTLSLRSTVTGLGTANYVSTASLTSTVRSFNSNMGTSNITLSNANVIIGSNAGLGQTGTSVVAIGDTTAASNTANSIIAMGLNAANTNSGVQTIAIGGDAARQNTAANTIAIGTGSGFSNIGNSLLAFGTQAGSQNTGGNTIAIGNTSGLGNRGTFLIAIGDSAGRSNQGANLIAIGQNAGFSSIGANLTAIGVSAGGSNTGSFNTFVGQFAGRFNTGTSNSFFGIGVGQSNSGSNVVAIGSFAGFSNRGSGSIIIGTGTGQFSKGDNNIALGNLSQYGLGNSNQNAPQVGSNISLGIGSMQDAYSTLNNNITFGSYSGYGLQGGSNILIGRSAGDYMTPGIFESIHMGSYAGSQGVGSSNISLGQNSLYRNTTSNSVAFGINAAQEASGNNIYAMGFNAGFSTTTTHLIAIGSNAGYQNMANNVITIGENAGYSNIGSNVIALGQNAGSNNTESDRLYIKGSAENTLVGDLANRRIGIATNAAPQFTLDVSGTANVSGPIQTQTYVSAPTVTVSTITFTDKSTNASTGSIYMSSQRLYYTSSSLVKEFITDNQLVSTAQGLTTYASSFIDTTEMNSTVRGLGRTYVSSGGALVRFDTTNSNIGITSNLTNIVGRCNVVLGGDAGTTFQQTSNIVGSIAIGPGALYQAQGTNSGSIGFVALGVFAGSNISSGNNGIAIGRFAGNGAIGEGLIAIGNTPGQNMRGIHQMAMGANAGKDLGRNVSTITGSNIMIGFNAGYEAVCTITNNVMIGTYAGYQGGAGSSNVFIGYSAGHDTNLAVNDGIYIGAMAGRFGTGDHNIAIGQNTFYSGIGSNNVILGQDAGYDISASNIIALGQSAGQNIQGRGDYFMVKGSIPTHPLIVDLSNSYVGIGQDNYPTCALDVDGDVRITSNLVIEGGVDVQGTTTITSIVTPLISSQEAYISSAYIENNYTSTLINTYQSTLYAEIQNLSTAIANIRYANISEANISSITNNVITTDYLNVISSAYVEGTLSANILAVEVQYTISTISTLRITTDEVLAKDEIHCYSTISTHSLVIYGASTLTVQGSSKFTGGIDVVNLTASGIFKADSISSPQVECSTLALLDQYTYTYDELFTSASRLMYHTYDLFEIIQHPQLFSTTEGLMQFVTNYIDPAELTSTIIGVGFGTLLESTVTGLGTVGYISSLSLQSTIEGLGSANYISSSQLASTTAGLTTYISSFIDPTELASTVIGLGSAGFVSTIGLDTKLASTVQGLGTANYVSSSQLVSTTAGLQEYVSSFIDPTELASTVIGLGSAGFVSTIGLDTKLASTVEGLGTATYISSSQLTSTVAGMGTAGYLSSVSGGNVIFRDDLTSTITGLGTANYISSTQLISTTTGLHTYISSFIDPTELTSTVIGLGTAGFLSSVQGGDVIFKSDLTSTVQGLGTASYISTATLQSSITGQLYVSTTGQVIYNNTTPLISLSEMVSTVQSLLNQPTVHRLQSYGF